ncbi:MAG: TlpA family protein disulfide reductase [Acidobacteria bacterium]|nr:TlpA family protein disulfide reductase [Acidobacteriota bacterium]
MESETPSTPPATSMRTVAIIATVVALIGISIPFTWDTHADAGGEPITAPLMEPVAAHASALELGAQADAAACMPNAKPATDFTLPALDGKKVSLSQFKGKVVLLNFWATWCGPCKAEIPGFVELQQQYKNDLVILGLSVDDPADKARAFADQYKVNYPMVLGLGHDEIQDAYGPIYGIPASFLISRDGKVCKRHLGIAPKSQFEREIKALL